MDNEEFLKDEPLYYSKEDLNAYLLDFISRYLSDNLQSVNCPSALVELEVDESGDYGIVDELHKRLWIANDIIANLILAAVKKTNTSLEKLIKKALPEIDSLYEHIIRKLVKVSMITQKIALDVFSEHKDEYAYIKEHHVKINYDLGPSKEKEYFRIRVLHKIAMDEGIELTAILSNIKEIIQNNNKIINNNK